MPKSYTPVPRFYHERFTIAIMCNESVPLHWLDEDGDRAYMATVYPQEIQQDAGMEYLIARADNGDTVRVRLDLIRNMPAPSK